MDDGELEALRTALDRYTYASNPDWYRTSNYEFAPYTDQQLSEAEEHFGHPFPTSYRYLLQNYESLVIGMREYCSRRGVTAVIHITALWMPPRDAHLGYSQWFRQIDDDLHGPINAEMIPRARQFLPIAIGVDQVKVGFDLSTGDPDAPIIIYDTSVNTTYLRFRFVADDLTTFMELPRVEEFPPPRACGLSEKGRAWYEHYDVFIDGLDLHPTQRRAFERATSPHPMLTDGTDR